MYLFTKNFLWYISMNLKGSFNKPTYILTIRLRNRSKMYKMLNPIFICLFSNLINTFVIVICNKTINILLICFKINQAALITFFTYVHCSNPTPKQRPYQKGSIWVMSEYDANQLLSISSRDKTNRCEPRNGPN